MIHYNPKLKDRARDLRKNATDAEKLLWSRIRRKQLKDTQFYRQRIVGDYIVDFFCPKAKIVIELDGEQHFTPEGKIKDRQRDSYLNELGIRVLRFTNVEVMNNIEGVLQVIWNHL
jgi:very-short-patch-repair endonuclease